MPDATQSTPSLDGDVRRQQLEELRRRRNEFLSKTLSLETLNPNWGAQQKEWSAGRRAAGESDFDIGEWLMHQARLGAPQLTTEDMDPQAMTNATAGLGAVLGTGGTVEEGGNPDIGAQFRDWQLMRRKMGLPEGDLDSFMEFLQQIKAPVPPFVPVSFNPFVPQKAPEGYTNPRLGNPMVTGAQQGTSGYGLNSSALPSENISNPDYVSGGVKGDFPREPGFEPAPTPEQIQRWKADTQQYDAWVKARQSLMQDPNDAEAWQQHYYAINGIPLPPSGRITH